MVPIARWAVPKACGVPEVQVVPSALRAFQKARGCSNSPEGGQGNNRTEIISPANEQYTIVRKAGQRPKGGQALRAFQRAGGQSNSPKGGQGSNRTEILSPANEQYKGRNSGGPEAEGRAKRFARSKWFQRSRGRAKR